MSDTIPIERVTSFQDPRAKQALVILNTLFEDTTAFLDGKEELCSMFFDITVKATIPAGQFIVAVNKTSGKVVGTVSFFPPGTDIFSDERQRQELGLEDFYTALSPAFFKLVEKHLLPCYFQGSQRLSGTGGEGEKLEFVFSCCVREPLESRDWHDTCTLSTGKTNLAMR